MDRAWLQLAERQVHDESLLILLVLIAAYIPEAIIHQSKWQLAS
jgi:hypothetical protein